MSIFPFRASFSLSLRTLAITLAVALLIGCNGDGGGGSGKKEDPPEPVTTVEGVVAKGPVGGATVEVYSVGTDGARSDSPMATVTANEEGAFSLSIGTYSGVYVVVAHGGSYIDEATGQERTIPESAPLRAVSSAAEADADTTVAASVTPLTEIATRVAESASGGLTASNVAQGNDTVAALFFGTSESPGATMLATRPSDVISEESADDSDDERLYGLMLGAISTLDAANNDLDATLATLAQDVGTHDSLQDTSAALVQATTTFVASNRNNSGVKSPTRMANVLTAAATGTGATVAASDDTDITSFRFDDTLSSEIDFAAHTVAVVQPSGSDLGALGQPTIALSLGATVAVEGDEDFSGAVTYVVTAEDESTMQAWTVTVAAAPSAASPLARITGTASDLIEEAVINRQNRAVTGTVATLADLVALDAITDPAAILNFSDGATATLLSGSFVGGDAVFRVTAEDGTTIRDWTVALRAIAAAAQPELTIAGGDLTVEVLSPPIQLLASGGIATAATSYASSDTAVATVDANGTVTIVGAGSATITVRRDAVATASVDYLAAEASIVVTVERAAQAALAFTEASVSVLLGGSVSNALTGGEGSGTITYSSSDTSVATVAEDGAITLVAAGSAEISAVKAGDATYLDSNEASFTLTVTAPPSSAPETCVFDQSNWDDCTIQ